MLRIKGISMEPKFHAGELIFVDPNAEPVNGSYVVAALEGTDEATFKQLIIEDRHMLLKALNPDWPDRIIKLDRRATICGVAIFKGEIV